MEELERRTAARSALVTGGSSGIGLACARRLASLGFAVAICGRDAARLAKAEPDCAAELSVVCDVGDRSAVDRLAQCVVERFGRLDVVVANAGAWRGAPIAELSNDDWDAVIRTNLTGTFNTIAATIDHLRMTRGYLFVVASIAAYASEAGFSAYSASKAGLRGLALAVREEAASTGVRITVISPGYVDTPFLRAESRNRAGVLEPDDVAETIAWCLRLSPAAIVREVVLEDSVTAVLDREASWEDYRANQTDSERPHA
jgi:NAD(P)-dependent dehydrogenase (short-subunit alcohol dehydrogenase family)